MATSTTTASWPDLESLCSSVWPPATCLTGCPDPENALWAEGYLDHLATAWGLPRSTVDQHVRVRHVVSYGYPSRHAEVTVQLEADWVVSVFVLRADLPGPPTSVADAAGAYSEWGSQVPQVDVTVQPRPWSEVETYVADCEARLGVTFPTKGCETNVTFDPNDDDQAGVRFDFEVPLSVREFAHANVYAWRSGPDQCDTNEYNVE